MMTSVRRKLCVIALFLTLFTHLHNIFVSSASTSSSSSYYSSTEGLPTREHCFHKTPSDTTVRIKYGTLRGELLQFGHDPSGNISPLNELEVFLGVPYASPPTGALRFMPPVTPAHWHGVRLADQLAPLCPQKIPQADLILRNSSEALKSMSISRFEWLKRMISRVANQSEDCLYLNVYSPALSLTNISEPRQQQQTKSFMEETVIGDNESNGSPAEEDDNEEDGVLVENDDELAGNDVREPFASRKWQSRSRRHRQQSRAMHSNEANARKQKRSPGGSSSETTNYPSPSSSPSSTPQSSSRRRHERTMANLPVIVFLTGESFDWSVGSLFDGSLLSSFGRVVVVTLNYRLGILGFLPANVDETIRGNYGLMDQVAALHWIQENIRQFGGNPGNVTLVGHGHGAAFAHLLMLSPMAKGLFNRVVLMSGSALSPWAIARDAPHYANHVGKQLGCKTNDNSQLVDCLRTKSIHELLSANYSPPDYLSAFGPIVDGIVVPAEPRIVLHQILHQQRPPQHFQQPQASSSSSSSSFPSAASALKSVQPNGKVSGSPVESASSSSYSPPPSVRHSTPAWSQWPMAQFPQPDLMAGVTKAESGSAIFSAHEERNGITLSRRDRILRTLVRNIFDYHQQAILQTLTNEYTDWTQALENPTSLMDSLTELLGDAEIVSGLVESLDHQNTHNTLFRAHHHSQQQQQQQQQQPTPSHSNIKPSISASNNNPTSGRIFFYVFSHQNTEQSKNRFHERLGASHGDELSYLFGVPILSRLVGPPIPSFASGKTKLSSSSSSPSSSLSSTSLSSTCDIVSSSGVLESSEDDDPYPPNGNDVSSSMEQSQPHHRHHHHRTSSVQRSLPTIDISSNHYSFTSTPSSGFRFVNYSDEEVALSQAIITYWVRFAAFGNPNGVETTTSGPSSATGKTGAHRTHMRRQQLNVNHESKTAELMHWPLYDITGKKFLNFGSRLSVHDHYHAHRLSVWLALIPRLHAPVDIGNGEALNQVRAGNSRKNNRNTANNNNHRTNNELDGQSSSSPFEGDSSQAEIDGAQLFYLRHHLLPDHENLDTYAGVVKGVEVALPSDVLGKDWLRLFGRKNMTSAYEQQQRLIYGGYGTLDGLNRKLMLAGNSPQPGSKKEAAEQQFVGRRTAISSPSFGSSTSSSTASVDNKPDTNSQQQHGDSSSTIRKNDIQNNSENGRTSVLHYSEAQTVDGYSTALLVTIVVGCSLLVLNVLVFLGVYFQIDRKPPVRDDSEQSESGDSTDPGTYAFVSSTGHCQAEKTGRHDCELDSELYTFEHNLFNKPQTMPSASGESNYCPSPKYDNNGRSRRSAAHNQTLTRSKPGQRKSGTLERHRKSSPYSSPYSAKSTIHAEVLQSHHGESSPAKNQGQFQGHDSKLFTQSALPLQNGQETSLSTGPVVSSADDSSANFQLFTGNDSPSVFYVHYGADPSGQCYLVQSTLAQSSGAREHSTPHKAQPTKSNQHGFVEDDANSMLIFGAENANQYQPVVSYVDGGNFVSFISATENDSASADNQALVRDGVHSTDGTTATGTIYPTSVGMVNVGLPVGSLQAADGLIDAGNAPQMDSNQGAPYLTLSEMPFSSGP